MRYKTVREIEKRSGNVSISYPGAAGIPILAALNKGQAFDPDGDVAVELPSQNGETVRQVMPYLWSIPTLTCVTIRGELSDADLALLATLPNIKRIVVLSATQRAKGADELCGDL